MDLARQIKNIAWSIAVKHGRDDKNALAQDLQMAGWEYVLSEKRPVEVKIQMQRIYGAMIDEWCRWTFGIGWAGYSKNPRMRPKVLRKPDNVISKAIGPEDAVIAQDLLDKTEVALKQGHPITKQQRQFRIRMVEEFRLMILGGSRSGTPQAALRARKKIREEMKRLLAA